MKHIAFLGMLLWLSTTAHAQNIVQAEYWIDGDNGFGQCTPITGLPTGSSISGSFPINTTSLSPGMHTVIVRSMDDSARWSHTNHFPLYVAAAPPTDSSIVRTEWFLNTDPGWGGGNNANIDGTTNVTGTANVDLATANLGMNTLFFRSRDASGRWSHTNHVPLYVADTVAGQIVRVEYFWDTDPGFGLATSYPVSTPSGNVQNEMDDVTVPAGFPLGSHLLFMRSQDSRGRWSHTNYRTMPVDILSATPELLASQGISVFPNPFAESINVQVSDAKPVRVIMYDPQGKQVFDRLITGSERIDLDGQANGVYTALFWNEVHVIHRVTVIKQ